MPSGLYFGEARDQASFYEYDELSPKVTGLLLHL
jgi:hypothetical protein